MKKKLWITICFIFALCGAVLMTVPAQAKVKKNPGDLKNVRKINAILVNNSADGDDDIYVKYYWDDDGHVSDIYIENVIVTGDELDMSCFKQKVF